jgi:SAM-dependent methyltransferase
MFPDLYHAHHVKYQEDLPFWLGLAQQHGAPVLELGCGSGRVLLPLAKAGYAMVGLDNDLEMLRFLRRTLTPEIQPAPLLFAASLTRFHLNCTFPLIVLPCNTWSVLDAAQRRQALDCIARHLAPGGIFAASLPNPEFLRDLPVNSEADVDETFLHPLTGNPVQVSSGWQRTRRNFTVTWHYDHLLPDGGVERLTVQAKHDLLPTEVYLDELRQAGLHIRALYGDFDGTPADRWATNLIFLASCQ